MTIAFVTAMLSYSLRAAADHAHGDRDDRRRCARGCRACPARSARVRAPAGRAVIRESATTAPPRSFPGGGCALNRPFEQGPVTWPGRDWRTACTQQPSAS